VQRPDPATLEPAVVVFEQGLKNGWEDRGWSRRDLGKGQPARIFMNDFGGWILGHPYGQSNYEAVGVRFKTPQGAETALVLELLAPGGKENGSQKLDEKLVTVGPDGWREALVPTIGLGGKGAGFDRIVVRAGGTVPAEPVLIDKIVLYRARDAEPKPVAKLEPGTKPARSASLTVSCRGPSHTINPLIYGIAYYPLNDAADQYLWDLGASARRWGGNHTSRYNWKLGYAWNAGADWFWENVNYTGDRSFSWTRFLDVNGLHKVGTALVVPTIGWVAKDVGSYSFPVTEFGPQQQTDPYRNDAGNGVSKSGEPLKPPQQTKTSVAMPPEDIEAWVRAIRKYDEKNGRHSVDLYILDNEPMLWNTTHRDVHPEPLGYDELLERTIAYASAVKRADPQARIAGPAEWGWPNYFYSAVDGKAGFFLKPDRRAHGDVPLLEWYLRKLKEHEDRTGRRLLDVLDVHFYPQSAGVGSGKSDPDTAARRLRSTRGLWDPDYVDESWIKEPIQLLPRLTKMVQDNYPGTKLAIGEWNVGSDKHISGGLALAEVLGRFTQSPMMEAAFYWTYPQNNSAAFWAFRAFRNYDGKGATFRDLSIPTKAAAPATFFASRDATGEHVVAVALNLDSQATLATDTNLDGCQPVVGRRVFRYLATSKVLAQLDDGDPTADVLPPWSITVYEWTLGSPVSSAP
jgi:hypothetical protein